MSQKSFHLLVVDDEILVHKALRLCMPDNWIMHSAMSSSEVNWNISYHGAMIDMHLGSAVSFPEGLHIIKNLSKMNSHMELVGMSEGTAAPFISVNLGSIPDSLFESELFGHIKGSFTGANSNKMGLTEAANGGILFLDEIEALPLNQQAKLLRFLETGEIRKVGAKEVQYVKTRIIVASNRPLRAMVKSGEFREDLYFRLASHIIELPPLRERASDIPNLVTFIIENFLLI